METYAPIIAINRHRFLVDGDGVTTLVAFHGCPLHCKYCLNPQCHTPEGIKEVLLPQQLYDKVKIDDIYFIVTGGGIMFGGGEPLLRSRFIAEFRKICEDKWKIYVETSLNVDKSYIEQLVDVIDYWIIDIKDWNDDIYLRYTGCDNKQVKTNLEYLLSRGCVDKIMVRVPSIPDYNSKSDISYTIYALNKLGINSVDQFDYLTDFSMLHERSKASTQQGINSGKFKCEVLKSIRRYVADYNNIEYKPQECDHTVCATGCCPMCDKELMWVTTEYYHTNDLK